MSNMSYCRFQNTLSDLQDCYNAMQETTTDKSDINHLNRLEKDLAAAKSRLKDPKVKKRETGDIENEIENLEDEIEDIRNEIEDEKLSHEEEHAKKQLIELCQQIADEYGEE